MIATKFIPINILAEGIIKISSALVNSIYYLTKISDDDQELKKILATTDIMTDILLIKSFIDDHNNLPKNDKIYNSNSVSNCIKSLLDILTELEANIALSTKKIEEHKKLWFSSYRRYDISVEKESIILNSSILKHRFDMLLKISNNL
jgi:hypothetical protein